MKLSCERCELEYAPHTSVLRSSTAEGSEGGAADGCPGCAFHPGGDPRHFGLYRILGVAGRGALGIVFRARREGHGSVALKILTHPDPRWVAPFEREGELTAKLSHPNIVKVRDRGSAESRPYIAFDYIAGRTLAVALGGGKLGDAGAARMGIVAAAALSYAHRQGVVHKDITPGNILLAPNGVPMITDFGLAAGPELPPGTTAGTPVYMSPEQASGLHDIIDARSDVYSLGAVLYHAAGGKAPFSGRKTLDILRKVREEEPAALEGVDPGLAGIIGRAMQKDPARRPRSMDALAESLQGWLSTAAKP